MNNSILKTFKLSATELMSLHSEKSAPIVLKSTTTPLKKDGRVVAVSGASGFLALHIIDNLVKDPRIVEIRCLLRSETKFKEKKKEFQLDFLEDKLVFIESDKATGFWPENAFENVHDFIHTAAALHNLKTFDQLYRDNVELTAQIVRSLYANTRLHYISTLSLFASSNITGRHKAEILKPTEGHMLYGGYAQTKYVAEQVAQLKGSFATSIRLGLLTPSLASPDFQSHEFFPLLLKRLKELGIYPENFEEAFVDVSPVDKVAFEIVSNLSYPGYVRHIASINPVALSRIIEILGLKPVSEEVWNDKIKNFKTLEKTLLDYTFFKSQALKNNFSRFNLDLFQSTGHDWAGQIDNTGYIERYTDNIK